MMSSSSLSTTAVKTIQAERLIENIHDSFEKNTPIQKHYQNYGQNNDFQQRTKSLLTLWNDFLRASDYIIEENSISDSLILNLKSKRSRLELEISRLKTAMIDVRSTPSSPSRATRSDGEEISSAPHTHQIPNVKSKHIPVEPQIENVDDKESAEKIQRLLQDQKEIHSKELLEEQRTQHVLLQELTDLTGILKNTTLEINESILFQNQQLTDITIFSQENQKEIEDQKKKMTERTKGMARSLWTDIATLAWVAMVFVLAYVVIRLFPKPSSNYFCKASS